jgi:ferredoxin
MTHIITSICLRDGGCVEVCPVECIVPGEPSSEWPLYYIDPETCIDCGACIPECPWEAIFPEEDVPTALTAKASITVHGEALPQRLNMKEGTPGFTEVYDGTNHAGDAVHLEATRVLAKGETVDLTPAIQDNYDYFSDGPGYP